VRLERVAQADLHLLKPLLRRALDVSGCLAVLIRTPLPGEHRCRVVIVADGRLVCLVEVALLGALLEILHP
jgi:hypothetical protein